MAQATVTPNVSTVEDWVKAHKDADPKELLEIVLAQTEMMRQEYKGLAEVELDKDGNFKPRTLAGLWRLGQMYSQSEMVPTHYKGKVADCTIAVQMALRCGVDILTFLQSSYIVHGTPGIKATLAIAMINGSGKIKGRIRYKVEGEGDNRKWIALATDADSGEEVSAEVTWKMVKAEGWDKPKGTQVSKWMTLPDQMGKYRAAMFLARTNFPDVLIGMYTEEELEDIHGVPATNAVSGTEQRVAPTSIDKTRSELNDLLDRQEEKEPVQEMTDAEVSQEVHGVDEAAQDEPAQEPAKNGGAKKQASLV
jgi:hypothetical protein